MRPIYVRMKEFSWIHSNLLEFLANIAFFVNGLRTDGTPASNDPKGNRETPNLTEDPSLDLSENPKFNAVT